MARMRKTPAQQRPTYDPAVTMAAAKAGERLGKALYGREMDGIVAEITALIRGRPVAQLSKEETVQLMALRARMTATGLKQRQVVMGEASRLQHGDDDPDGGVPAAPRPQVLT